jgi:hypothetical protein
MKTTSKEPAKKATATKSDKTSSANAASKSTKHAPAKPAVTEVKTATHRAAAGPKEVVKPSVPAATTASAPTATSDKAIKVEAVTESKPTASKPTTPKSTDFVEQLPIVAHLTTAILAYQLWQSRGYRHGHDFEDWIEAERQLQLQ